MAPGHLLLISGGSIWSSVCSISARGGGGFSTDMLHIFFHPPSTAKFFLSLFWIFSSVFLRPSLVTLETIVCVHGQFSSSSAEVCTTLLHLSQVQGTPGSLHKRWCPSCSKVEGCREPRNYTGLQSGTLSIELPHPPSLYTTAQCTWPGVCSILNPDSMH